MKKLLVILGPTATGKTDLGISLAKRLNGELVACDSRQVYKGLDIGTGKLPGQDVSVQKSEGFWLIDGIKVWMYDVVSPQIRFTVKDYKLQSEKVIEKILDGGKLPIIVGGTGFYLKALLEGLPNLDIPVDLKLRVKLSELSLEQLQQHLQSLSFEKWQLLNDSDKMNKRRLLRSIELIYMYPYMDKDIEESSVIKNADILKIGLTAPSDLLKLRINSRITSRINQGMIEEAKTLHNEGLSQDRMKELGLEYSLLANFLTANLTNQQLLDLLKTKIYQYAKRQLTWFKREKDVNWVDITDKNYQAKVEKMVDIWYHKANDS